MNPLTDSIIAAKVKRPVGRPMENPFASEECEEDFVRRGSALIERCFQPKGPNTRLDFVLGPDLSVSKTSFWSFVFVYLLDKKKIKNNVQGYHSAILRHFGKEVVSDRPSISSSVKMLNSLYITFPHTHNLQGASKAAHERYRSRYEALMKLWDPQPPA